MNTYPLIRTKWSNEIIMAALYLLLILYHIPLWCKNPLYSIHFILLTLVGLALDAVVNIVRFKRLWCCVSAAVTAAIISLLSEGVPLWGQILGLISALILGKHIWGGTGKNRINPAMVGLIIILLFWNTPFYLFMPSYLLIPAVILSLPFLKSRPFAGIAFIAGALAALLFNNDLSLASILSSGVFFWGCIVMTDPVTVTRRPLGGIFAGCFAGFFSFHMYNDLLIIIALVFMVNLYSYITDNYVPFFMGRKLTLKIPKAVSDSNDILLNLIDENSGTMKSDAEILKLKSKEIIAIIRDKEVFGMGGAGFPVYKKILSVLSCDVPEKYLILNGVECDPGLIHDHYLLRNFPDEILKGINIIRHCVEFKSVFLATRDTKRLVFPENIILHKSASVYPAGAERFVIKEILHRNLDKDQLPVDNGILVLNVQTVYAIYKAVYEEHPADTRFLTVADLTDKTAKVAQVRLGIKLKDVMEAAYPGRTGCFAGGGIMQAHFVDENETVNRTINFIAVGTMPKFKESVQCSKCKNCVSNCPAGLEVNKIADLVDEGKLQETLKYNALDCMGCGSCSYSCLAGRNLAAKIKAAKDFAELVCTPLNK